MLVEVAWLTFLWNRAADLVKGLTKVVQWFFKRPPASGGFRVPKKTIIAMPIARSTALCWSSASVNGKPCTQLVFDLQLTNISDCGIRISDFKILKPKLTVLDSLLTVEDANTRFFSPNTIIPKGSIAPSRFVLFVAPPFDNTQKPTKIDIALYDQFSNAHVLKNLSFRRFGD